MSDELKRIKAYILAAKVNGQDYITYAGALQGNTKKQLDKEYEITEEIVTDELPCGAYTVLSTRIKWQLKTV